MKKLFRNRPGFTLVEILIVMTIIAIMASLAVPYVHKQIKRSKEAALLQNLFTIRDVIDQYYADKGQYPGSLQELVQDRYIRSVPKDPLTNSSNTWVLVAPADGMGVYDVHSGDDGTGSDGKPYREW